MNVLAVEPGKVPCEKEMDGTLKGMQAYVGGLIEVFCPYDHDKVALICNEEGKVDGLPLNRAIYNEDGEMLDIIAGPFFICGLGEEDFTSLPPGMMEKYRELFKHPETFTRIAGKVVAVKQPVEDADQSQPKERPPKGDRGL